MVEREGNSKTMEMDSKEIKGEAGCITLNVHVANVTGFQYDPISCMGLSVETKKLAIFRSGDSPAIEVWDLANQTFLDCTLYDLESVNGKVSVESLAWAKGRLFSAGLHGFVIEHDLATRNMKKKYAATSGPVWNLATSPDESAIGAVTEDGFVNIFDVLDDELQFRKVLDRQEGRILCLAWSPCGKYIATGSVDNIRLWDVERGRAIQRLTTGRSKKNETIVWSVKIIDKLTIVSGDSRGIVSFWDGNLGVLKFKIGTHRADILCMSVSPDESIIYVAGVDPSIVLLQRVGKNGDKWVKSHQRLIHTNDVTCMQALGIHLISGGLDCELTISTPPVRQNKQIIRKYPPFRKSPTIFASSASKRILVQESRGLTLWQMPDESNDKELVNLLDFRSSGDQIVFSSSLSPSGNYMVYTTFNKAHFFRFASCNDGSVVPVRLKRNLIESITDDEKSAPEPQNLLSTFLNDTHVLVLPIDGSLIQVWELSQEEESCLLKSEIETSDYLDASGLRLLHSKQNYAAVATRNQEIFILSFDDNSALKDAFILPSYSCAATSLLFHDSSPLLLITYSDHSFRMYNYLTRHIVVHDNIGGPKMESYKRKQPNPRSNRDEKPSSETAVGSAVISCQQPILSSSWSADGSVIIFREVNKLHYLELDCERLSPEGASNGQVKAGKQPKLELTPTRGTGKTGVSSPKLRRENLSEDTNMILKKKTFECDKSYKYVSHIEFLDDKKELLLVEVKPSTLVEKLPPAFARKRFGM